MLLAKTTNVFYDLSLSFYNREHHLNFISSIWIDQIKLLNGFPLLMHLCNEFDSKAIFNNSFKTTLEYIIKCFKLI